MPTPSVSTSGICAGGSFSTLVELLRREQDAVAHAAIDVDADDAHARAAVRAAAQAGGALAAGDVRVHRAAVAGRQARRRRRRSAAPRPPARGPRIRGIGEERLRAFERVQVGAADADRQDAHERFAGPGAAGAAVSPSVKRPGCSSVTVFMGCQDNCIRRRRDRIPICEIGDGSWQPGWPRPCGRKPRTRRRWDG